MQIRHNNFDFICHIFKLFFFHLKNVHIFLHSPPTLTTKAHDRTQMRKQKYGKRQVISRRGSKCKVGNETSVGISVMNSH